MGEQVEICLDKPIAPESEWVLLDYDGATVAKGAGGESTLSFGTLPVGHYRLEHFPSQDPLLTTIGVLAPLAAPVGDGPIGIKAQMSFQFYEQRKYTMEDAASLMALAGASWVQNGLIWKLDNSMELARLGAEACADQGMNVLVSTETTPEELRFPARFGNKVDKKFPEDLRAYYRHLLEAGSLMSESVEAWEIRGEPAGNGGAFLPHEIAAGEKVAWLALKQGNERFRLGIGVPTGNPRYLEGLLENQIVDYSDVWFFHSHQKGYHLEKDLVCRDLLATLPVWESEGSYGSYPGLPGCRTELSHETERRMVNDLAKFYARAIMNNSSTAFYFRFFTHSEVNGQMWGMVRNEDLTPRPQFNALAAAGQMLAQAKPLGWLTGYPEGTEACLFQTRTGGGDAQVVVIWNDRASCTVSIPDAIAFDAIGRKTEANPLELEIGTAPIYLVVRGSDLRETLPFVAVDRPGWTDAPPPKETSPVVLNLTLPDSRKDIRAACSYILYSGESYDLPIEVYNFSSNAVSGEVEIALGDGLASSGPTRIEVEVEPLGRAGLTVPIRGETSDFSTVKPVVVRGDFGAAGRPLMKFNVSIRPGENQKTIPVKAIASYRKPEQWKKRICINSTMSKTQEKDWMVFRYTFGAPRNKVINLAWAGPRLELGAGEQPESTVQGLSFSLRKIAGENLEFALIVVEGNGERFISYFPINDEAQLCSPDGVSINVPFASMYPAAFNEKDRQAMKDNTLDVDQITGIELVMWTRPHSEASIAVKDLTWVLFGHE